MRRLAQLTGGILGQPAPAALPLPAGRPQGSASAGLSGASPAAAAAAAAPSAQQQPAAPAAAPVAVEVQQSEQYQRQQRRQQEQAAAEQAAAAQNPGQAAKRHKQQQASAMLSSQGKGDATPSLPATSSSGHSACAAVSLPSAGPAQLLQHPAPTGPSLQAARSHLAAALAEKQELWEPVAPLTPAGRLLRPCGTAQPAPAAAAASSAAAAAAVATPMHSSAGQQPLQQQHAASWPPVRLAAAGAAATGAWPQTAPPCSWQQPSATWAQPLQPGAAQHTAQAALLVQPWQGSASLPQQQAGRPMWAQPQQPLQLQHAELLPPPPKPVCWPSQHLQLQCTEQPHQTQQAELQWQAYCINSGISGGHGRSASPCLPCFDRHEIQALVEVLNPPSLDLPDPDLVAEALACATGTGTCCAAGTTAPGAAPNGACGWCMPPGLCSGPACGGPVGGGALVRLQASSPPPQHAQPPDGWADSAAAWQQLFEAGVREGEQRAALAFAAMQLPPAPAAAPAAPPQAPSPLPDACCPPGGASQGQAGQLPQPSEAGQQSPLWEWPEELFAAAPMPCPPSPAVSWML